MIDYRDDIEHFIRDAVCVSQVGLVGTMISNPSTAFSIICLIHREHLAGLLGPILLGSTADNLRGTYIGLHG
jgi:hypothetical protein